MTMHPPLIATYNLSFCDIEIYEDFVINTMKEGITAVPNYHSLLKIAVNQFFANKPFVYISNRINSYAIDPEILTKMCGIENLVGFGVVSDAPQQKMQVQLEEMFFKKEIHLFSKMNDALIWKSKVIETHKVLL